MFHATSRRLDELDGVAAVAVDGELGVPRVQQQVVVSDSFHEDKVLVRLRRGEDAPESEFETNNISLGGGTNGPWQTKRVSIG